MYIAREKPHEGPVHNDIEQFNEISIIVLQYHMIFFVEGSGLDPKFQWSIGQIFTYFVGLIFLVNFAALIYMTIKKVMLWIKSIKKRNLKKILLKSRISKGAIKQTKRKPTKPVLEELDIQKTASEIATKIDVMPLKCNENTSELVMEL